MAMPHPELQILVCVNDRGAGAERPCCAAGGGLDLYRKLKDLIRERGLKQSVLVTRTGCLRHCSRGPTVAVWPANRWYGGVAVANAEELLQAELDGRELARLRMPPGDWE